MLTIAAKDAKVTKKKGINHLYKTYKVSGEKAERSNKFCPKCGPGFVMAKHKDRRTCGKCGYMEK